VQTYPVRSSHRGNLSLPAIERIARQHFDSVAVDPTSVTASFGAIERLTVRPNGRQLQVEVLSNPKVGNDVAAATIARYNRFLEAATGYSAKERARRLRKSAAEPTTGTPE
jgi:hypothetical protein